MLLNKDFSNVYTMRSTFRSISQKTFTSKNEKRKDVGMAKHFYIKSTETMDELSITWCSEL